MQSLFSATLNRLWRLLRYDGEWAIRPKFKEFERFSKGLVAGCTLQGWSYFDAAWRQVIPDWFEGSGDFVGGVAAVKRDGLWPPVNSAEKWIVRPAFESVWRCGSSMFLVTSVNQYQYMIAVPRVIWTSEEYGMPQFPLYEA